MHYYNFNIGDYLSHTRHLSPIEDICYRRLLDYYYLHEKPLINDIVKLSRQLMLNDCSSSVEQVLNEYFYLHENEWHNYRCDAEISAYKATLEARSKAGKASGYKRREQVFNKCSTNDELNKKQEPINNNQETEPFINQNLSSAETDDPEENDNSDSGDDEPLKKKAKDETPYQEIIALYHDICIDLPACKSINDKRKKWIRARWNSKNQDGVQTRQNLDWWRKFFTVVAQSDWLCGRNDKGWAVNSFDWLVNETNFSKICEGAYKNPKKGGQ